MNFTWPLCQCAQHCARPLSLKGERGPHAQWLHRHKQEGGVQVKPLHSACTVACTVVRRLLSAIAYSLELKRKASPFALLSSLLSRFSTNKKSQQIQRLCKHCASKRAFCVSACRRTSWKEVSSGTTAII